MTIFDSVVKYTEDILGICLNCPFEFRVCFIERVKVSQDFVYGVSYENRHYLDI